MAKYRILQEGKSSFYPQEKLSIFHPWRYVDNLVPRHTWSEDCCHQGKCSTLEEAEERVVARKEFLKEQKKYPIIHKTN